MTDARDNPQAIRLRVLRRRIVLGTLAVLALFFAFWRAWELESRLFLEFLVGSVLLVVVMAVVGAAVALCIGWIRKRRDHG
ncbi:MAG: hypothetical protein EA417_11090 [Gammaproteobacteria bacterium]|nr:MAG: hypothetical protein EA417_11090 [Gammaproteobacteria bacterium]